jgi:hypothetical protein
MDFSDALDALKYDGYKVARKGWNGKGMFIYLVKSQTISYDKLRNEAAAQFESNKDSNRGKRITINGHIDMKTADGSITVGWVPSQVDMLADDWEIVH